MCFKSFWICLLGVSFLMFFRFSEPHFLHSEADVGAVLNAILGRGIAFCVGGVHFFAIFWAAQNRFQNRPRGSSVAPRKGSKRCFFRALFGGFSGE